MTTTEQALKERLQSDMKQAMRAKDKARLGAIRLILAAVKQREVDERIELDNGQIVAVLDKMVKQRRDAMGQYESAGREDLAAQERYEISVIQDYLPASLSEEELERLIADAISETNASSPRDMGKVMGILKPKVQGRCDLGDVSKNVKFKLTSL